MYGVRHGAHAFGVPGLDLEVVGRVQRELLDLVSQPVPHHRLDDPVVDLGVHVCAVVDNVAYDGEGSRSTIRLTPITGFLRGVV